jgi:hypothetical protein
MQIVVSRTQISIIPDNEMELAYLENTFGLRKKGDFVRLVRENNPLGKFKALTVTRNPSISDADALLPTIP